MNESNSRMKAFVPGVVWQSPNSEFSLVAKYYLSSLPPWIMGFELKRNDTVCRSFQLSNSDMCIAAAVANNGDLVLACNENNGLSSSIGLYDCQMQQLFFRKCNEPIIQVAISDDSSVFCYYTDITDSGRVCDKLHILQSEQLSNESVFSPSDLFGWGVFPDVKYISRDTIGFADAKGRISEVTHEGVLVDPVSYRAYKLTDAYECDGGMPLYYIALECCDEEAIPLLNAAIEKVLPDDMRAKVYRRMGEIAERRGYLREAVSCYETALGFDAKVGIRRRYAILVKKLNE